MIISGALKRTINKEQGGREGPFARLERSEISVSEFCQLFELDCKKHGQQLNARQFLKTVDDAVQQPSILSNFEIYSIIS